MSASGVNKSRLGFYAAHLLKNLMIGCGCMHEEKQTLTVWALANFPRQSTLVRITITRMQLLSRTMSLAIHMVLHQTLTTLGEDGGGLVVVLGATITPTTLSDGNSIHPTHGGMRALTSSGTRALWTAKKNNEPRRAKGRETGKLLLSQAMQ